jgi:hypothetical protein
MFRYQPRNLCHHCLATAIKFILTREYGLQREKAPDYQAEIPIARDQFREHKARLARLRQRNIKRRSGTP